MFKLVRALCAVQSTFLYSPTGSRLQPSNVQLLEELSANTVVFYCMFCWISVSENRDIAQPNIR